MIITTGSKIIDGQGNDYVLDEVLGKGGFGSVYKAHRENDGVKFAVKIIQNTFGDQTAFLSFKKETNLSMLIESENVIKYLYVHNGEDHPEYPPYIIMEYTDGGTLRDFINNQRGEQFDIETLKSIFLQLANGMKCISEHLVHRDIKPENILNFNGVLKISDFGLSKISGDSTKTMTFKNAGTPLYIAPEAWNNDNNTVQMDIYSMGIVFYELATLSYPYSDKPRVTYEEFKEMHLFESVNNPSLKNPALPPSIVSMLLKMLEKPTQKRFKNWDEIIDFLNSQTQQKNDLSEIVNRAIYIRNQKDLQLQTERAEKEKAKQEKNDYIKLVYSQYVNDILNPIIEFSDKFNDNYPTDRKIRVQEPSPWGPSPCFSTEITLPSGNNVTISGEVILKEDYTRTDHSFSYSITNLPQCQKKSIILWCQVKDTYGLGFNILLLKSNDGIYGDWVYLVNYSNAFSSDWRPSPFGFDLSELPEQIQYLNMTHIYNMEIIPFSTDRLITFLAERI